MSNTITYKYNIKYNIQKLLEGKWVTIKTTTNKATSKRYKRKNVKRFPEYEFRVVKTTIWGCHNA